MQTIKRFCLEKELGMQQRQKKQKSATILDEIRTKISVILAEKNWKITLASRHMAFVDGALPKSRRIT